MSRIAIVEDVEANRLLLAKVLRHAGHEVLQAEDGERGVELVLRELPDLVLMDLSLPGIDGYEALRRLRADGRSARIPVIALTARAMAEDRDEALRAGFDHYIPKPIDVLVMARLLEPFLPAPDATP